MNKKQFTIPAGYKTVAWADVKQDQDVYLLGTDNGKPRAYGPHKVLNVDDRSLLNTGRHRVFFEPLEMLLVKDVDWTIEAEIITLLQEKPQSVSTLSLALMKKGSFDYFDLLLTTVPRVIRDLQVDGVIIPSHSVQYFCGDGNGTGIEWFFKLV